MLTLAIVLLLLCNSISYAQILKGLAPNILYSPHKLHTSYKPRIVTITFPAKGQQVPVGQAITIQGISAANASSHCQVYVIVNSVKPYQPATATGPGGPTDYSKWNYVLTSKYTTIKQGPNNKITAKYTCKDNHSLKSFYSVNLKGVAR
jgi:hypothetical protein